VTGDCIEERLSCSKSLAILGGCYGAQCVMQSSEMESSQCLVLSWPCGGGLSSPERLPEPQVQQALGILQGGISWDDGYE
jgi:hypothetical protein